MTKQKSRYLSYLLRLWQTGDEENTVWRASLESPTTGERQGFASLKKLCAFLQAQTGDREYERIFDKDGSRK